MLLEPLLPLNVAVMVVDPAFRAVTSPEVLTEATPPTLDNHVAVALTSCVLPSLYEAVAVSWLVVPVAISKVAGVTATDCSDAAFTCNAVTPERAPIEAVIVEFPAETAVARPELSIVAILPFDDVQVALLEISCVLPSLNVPVAVNCCVAPAAIEGLAGVTRIEAMIAEVTVVDALAVIDPTVAVIVTLPMATVVTTPLLSTVAIVVSEESQVGESTCVLPSVNSPIAII